MSLNKKLNLVWKSIFGNCRKWTSSSANVQPCFFLHFSNKNKILKYKSIFIFETLEVFVSAVIPHNFKRNFESFKLTHKIYNLKIIFLMGYIGYRRHIYSHCRNLIVDLDVLTKLNNKSCVVWCSEGNVTRTANSSRTSFSVIILRKKWGEKHCRELLPFWFHRVFLYRAISWSWHPSLTPRYNINDLWGKSFQFSCGMK